MVNADAEWMERERDRVGYSIAWRGGAERSVKPSRDLNGNGNGSGKGRGGR